MKIIQNILQKTKASKLWFAMMVAFIAILSASAVEAKSLKTGEEFKEKNGGAIRIISSDEVEIERANGNGILLGKYTVDGERVRVVYGMFGASVVEYYKITPDGLVEEKGGKVFYSKTGLTATRFSFNGGEVTDKRTGLIWRRCAEGMVYRGGTCKGTASTFTHEQALQHAKSEASRVGKAWRVPEKDELTSIMDKSYSNPMIDPTAFPATPVEAFWSASPYVGDSGNAWFVKFGDGYAAYDNRGYDSYVRLVRAGQ